MARNWGIEQPPTAARLAGFAENRPQTTTATASRISFEGVRAAKGYVLPKMTTEVVELFRQQGATIPNPRRHSHRILPIPSQHTTLDGASRDISIPNSSSPNKVLHNKVENTDGSPRPSKMQKINHEKPASWARYKATMSYVATTQTDCPNPSKRLDTKNFIACQIIGSTLSFEAPKKADGNIPGVGWATKLMRTESKKAEERVAPPGICKVTPRTTHILPPPQLTSTPNHCPSEGRPETTDVVARRMIGAALGVAIPKKGDEKTVAVNKVMRLKRSDERLAAWGEYKGSK